MQNSPPSSGGYSTTPALHLALRPSLIGAALGALFLAAVVAAPLLLLRDGYPLLAACAALYCPLYLGWRRAPRPRALRREHGGWLLRLPGEGWCRVEWVPPVIRLPWLVYLRWRRPGGGAAGRLCLWPDSGEAQSLRRVRKHLGLELGAR